jgi:DNA-binding MarR family transcriptional regulator
MRSPSACACTNLRRVARAVTQHYDTALGPAGLRITQFALLRALRRRGPLSITELALEAALDRSTMGRNLDPLEARGLVALEPGTADRRARVVSLTPEGEQALSDAIPLWERAQTELAGRLGPGRLDHLTGVLADLELAVG